jgi:PAS domain S-box-containing protein
MSAEHAQWKTDQQFRLLIEGVADYAIFLIDPAGQIVTWNPGAERLLGYTEAEISGKYYSCLFTPEDALRGEPEQELRTALQAGRSEDVRWHVRKDGTRLWGDGVVTPLKDDSGNLRCFAKLLRDRTDQKEYENLLRHRAEALADADEKKNIFLATLAHELRNPLAGVVNAMNVLRLLSKDNPGLDHPLKIIERQAHHIRRLVDDLNDVARISTGKIQLHKERVALATVVQNAVEATRPLIESRRHHLSVSLPEAPIYLEADPTRLQQVFANLLTNAARYTDEGGQITLSGTVQDVEVVVRVRDTGIGISGEMLPRIFDLFTQVDPSKGHTQGGLGIGLSLVKNLMELHGGSVQARSDGIGKGSEFIVRLPARQEP